MEKVEGEGKKELLVKEVKSLWILVYLIGNLQYVYYPEHPNVENNSLTQ